MILLETCAADEMDVEHILWVAHSDVARVYKGAIENLVSTDHAVVLKRKIEKLYLSYLRTAQLFYKGLLQRLCAFYNIKELKRIARLAEVEGIQVPDNSKPDAETKKLEEIATDTCHKILVHLGDLSRYRTDARPNDRHWSGALTYYALANDLIPESGYGHHQCGVIYLKTGNHLEVVYHFYRALVGEKRHPHALTNLDVQFKRLRLGKAGVASNDAMISWFVKLHANYFQGDPFSGQKELEDEVDTRLAMALKNGHQADLDMDLLKMILINILAYQVSLDKAKSEWTDTASRSCQFILLQNIRTIHTISRLLLDELVEMVHRQPVESNSTAQKEDAGQFSPTFHRVLPLLRVYMAWLCFNSANVVEYKDHLEPRFGQMCKTLAQVLNLLFELLTSDISNIKKQVPWRLPEDEETLGMECLNGPGLPVGCQLCLDPISLEPKPRAEELEHVTYTADQISYTRTLNVISCAVSLANQSPFPIVLSKILEGPKESSRFVYTEGGRLNPPFQPDQSPSFHSRSANSALVAVPDVVEQQHVQHETALIQATADDSDEFSEDQDFYSDPLQSLSSSKYLTPPNGSTSRHMAAPPAEFPVEYQLYNIISDLLAPPETDPTVAAKKKEEAQAVASKQKEQSEEVTGVCKIFGAPPPASPVAPKPIPTLPWNYFYTPAPVEAGARSASGNSPGWEQPFAPVTSRPSTARNATPVLAIEGKNSTLAFRSPRQSHNSGEPSPLQSGGHRTSTSELVGLGSVSGPDLAENTNNTLKGYGHGARDAWTGAKINTTNTPPANPWGAPAGRWELGQNSPLGQTVPQSSFSSLSFSGMDSSLPPVNSPWGVSMKAPQAALGTGQSPVWRDHVRSSSGLSSSMRLAQTNMDRNSTPGLPSPIGGAYDSMAAYADGNNSPAGLPAASGYNAPQSDEYQRQQASMNAWINDYQPKMTPPPGLMPPPGLTPPPGLMPPGAGPFVGVPQGQAVRAGTIQKPRQLPTREPFGPGENGKTNFNSMPKR